MSLKDEFEIWWRRTEDSPSVSCPAPDNRDFASASNRIGRAVEGYLERGRLGPPMTAGLMRDLGAVERSLSGFTPGQRDHFTR